MSEITINAETVEVEVDEFGDPNEKYICPVCGAAYGNRDSAAYCCDGQIAYRCSQCEHIFSEDEYYELQDGGDSCITKWYLVSEWLCKRLSDCGETTIVSANIWGRTHEATANLAEDPSIVAICAELGILEHQEHEWPVR